MKKVYLIFAACLFMVACEKDCGEMDSCSNNKQSEENPDQGKANVSRPFEIIFTTAVDPNPAIPPTPCSGDLPGLANAGLFVSGNASQLGKLDATQSRLQDVSCNLSFATGLLTTSIAGQFAAANGDLVYFTGEDELNVVNLLTGAGPTGTITGVWTITGGTGRFAGATGSFTINGPVDFASASFSGTGLGTITY